MGAFEANPKEFALAIFQCIEKANYSGKSESIPFECYANYIDSQPSSHADTHQLYVHAGNTVLNINPYCRDFEDLIKSNPDALELFIETAEDMVKEAKRKWKKAKGKI